MYNRDQSRSMQPPPSSSRSLQIDSSLNFPTQSYYEYPHPSSSSLVPNQSSPSGSESVGTPPDIFSAGKRSSSQLTDPAGGRKRPRLDDGSEEKDTPEPKAKTTRGSRACTVCRRLKMKCVGAENGPPCKRCQSGNHECRFEESNRGKRSTNPRKHELLTRSMRKIEKTLDTVLRSLGNPSLASGMVSRSPSPTADSDSQHPLRAIASATEQLISSPTEHSPDLSYQNKQSSRSPKLHSLPDDSLNPLGLLAEASLANRRKTSNHHGLVARPLDAQATGQIGVASDAYFKPGPMTILPLRRLYIERQIQPEMLSITSTEEVVALFDIFFDHLNLFATLLDRNFHTPALVCSRSPFLLTVICAISSKFYEPRPDLHPKLMDLARKLAFSVPEKGYKSVEIVQAYLLLTWWGSGPVERYENDKTWLLLGIAIRMATDLNLHRKTTVANEETEDGQARVFEVHNRERTWLTCFNLDKSLSAQMGKPHTIKEDYIIRNTRTWYRSSAAIPSDFVVAAYAEYQRIISRSLDLLYSNTNSPSGLQIECDHLVIIQNIESQILTWYSEWDLGKSPFPGIECLLLCKKFYLNYGMLVVNSFGLQNALEKNPINIGHFFGRCHTSAIASISVMKDEMAVKGYLKYSPDSHFVQSSYALLTLLKLLRPELRAYVDEQKTLNFIRETADVFDSVAASPLHTPALYSVFLRALVSARKNSAMTASDADNEAFDDETCVGAEDGLTQGIQSSYSGFQPVGGSNNSGTATNGYSSLMKEFQFDSEMGPVADISTFPPTMVDPPPHDQSLHSPLSLDNIFPEEFWDTVLVPGTANTLGGLSGGFVYGVGGSGIITPRLQSPFQSGLNSPMSGRDDFTHQNLISVFDNRREEDIRS